jgi:FHS family L-fucose permease-like MFS transporter
MNSEQTKSIIPHFIRLLPYFSFGDLLSIKRIFIPFCKAKFGLDQFQSQLIDFAFMVLIMLELYCFHF